MSYVSVLSVCEEASGLGSPEGVMYDVYDTHNSILHLREYCEGSELSPKLSIGFAMRSRLNIRVEALSR